MQKILILLLLFIGLNGVAQSTYVHKKSGISVSFVIDDEMFPESWLGGTINGTAISLEESEYDRCKKIINKALDKYPLDLVKDNLKKIYFLNHLEFYGVHYGGTNSTDVIYLTSKGEANNYTDLYLEQIFHEELSSIFLRNYASQINESTWMQCASDSITYGGTGADAIRNGKAGEDFDTRINENGFLGEYATSNFENDINSFAKNIFCPKPGFWNLIEVHERLKCKLEIIIAFYSAMHEDLNEDFFKKLGE